MSSRLEELLERVTNPMLLLQRYLAYPKGDNGRRDATWRWELGRQNYKNEAWRGMENALKEAYKGEPAGKWLTELQARNEILEEDLIRRCYKIQIFFAKVVWRLIVGLGLPSPLEAGITLHHLYGIPYLPGSAIKGVTRNWKLQKIADELGVPRLNAEHIKEWKEEKDYGLTPWERLEQLLMSPVPDDSDSEEHKRKLLRQVEQRRDDLENALNKPELEKWQYLSSVPRLPDKNELIHGYIRGFSRAFGSTEAKGEVIFLDAYPESLTTPEGEPILELDVMNPHYGEYYQENEPPADWLSPVPVFFLVVRKDTCFIVRLASREQNLLGTIESWVREALKEFGIGAKTRAGYGELGEAPPQALERRAEAPSAARVSTDLTAELQAAIERWTPGEMGTIQQLVERLASLPDLESRFILARRLQQKLQEGKKWGGKYQDKAWHRTLEEILAGKTGRGGSRGKEDENERA